MRRKIAAIAFALIAACLMPVVLASAQELHKTYALPSGGHIQIKNVSGDIKVTGYNGDSVMVDAIPVGRDRDMVQIEDSSGGDRIELHVRYPQSCNCDASVDFNVRVPSGVAYNFDALGSVSGNVEIAGIRGQIHASSVSGQVTVTEVTGIVSASSVSGSVEAEITRLEGPAR